MQPGGLAGEAFLIFQAGAGLHQRQAAGLSALEDKAQPQGGGGDL